MLLCSHSFWNDEQQLRIIQRPINTANGKGEEGEIELKK